MTILFTGGGTLGSVTPLLATAEAIRAQKPRASFLWIGTRTGPERAVVMQAGIPFHAFPAGKFRRYWSIKNTIDIAVIFWAFLRALFFLRRIRPDVVVGAGAYVQVPVMFAARILRIPVVIHQLDARPTLSNRFVAVFASRITATLPSVGANSYFGRQDVLIIGGPIRASLIRARGADQRGAKEHFGFSGERFLALVLGGGTGAAALNGLVWDSLSELTRHVDVLHVTGQGKEGRIKNSAHYRAYTMLTSELPIAFAAADIVITRAGMGTIIELGSLGKASALVPMPNTHQEENARRLEEQGAVEVWEQYKLTPEIFVNRLMRLLSDHKRRTAMVMRFRRIFPDGAAEKLAHVIVRARKK